MRSHVPHTDGRPCKKCPRFTWIWHKKCIKNDSRYCTAKLLINAVIERTKCAWIDERENRAKERETHTKKERAIWARKKTLKKWFVLWYKRHRRRKRVWMSMRTKFRAPRNMLWLALNDGIAIEFAITVNRVLVWATKYCLKYSDDQTKAKPLKWMHEVALRRNGMHLMYSMQSMGF